MSMQLPVQIRIAILLNYIVTLEDLTEPHVTTVGTKSVNEPRVDTDNNDGDY